MKKYIERGDVISDAGVTHLMTTNEDVGTMSRSACGVYRLLVPSEIADEPERVDAVEPPGTLITCLERVANAD